MTKSVALLLRQMEPFVNQMVEKKVREILEDPDYGLKISSTVRKRFHKKHSRRDNIPAEKVAAKLGLS